QRHLTVLSGDYFSTYCYLYLAEKNQPELIQGFANVMKVVNECKMELHDRKETVTLEEKLDLKVTSRSQITKAILSWFDASSQWLDIYRLFLQVHFYLKEPGVDGERIERSL